MRTIVTHLHQALTARPRAPYCSVCDTLVPECHPEASACTCTICSLQAAYKTAFDILTPRGPQTPRSPLKASLSDSDEERSNDTTQGVKVAPAQRNALPETSGGPEQPPIGQLTPDQHAQRILNYGTTRAKALLRLHRKNGNWKHANWKMVEEGLKRGKE